jgi:hypothetical protein
LGLEKSGTKNKKWKGWRRNVRKWKTGNTGEKGIKERRYERNDYC